MSVVAAEGIKLASTRSPWWAAGSAVVATVGVGAIVVVEAARSGQLSVASTQFAYTLGMAVVMVMATLAVTTEYTTGTIRTTFLAVPRRRAALLAKTAVVAVVGGVVGLVGAFGSWGASLVLQPGAELALAGPVEWRQVAGVGLVHLVAAVAAVAVGILVRHTAGAVSLVLVWSLMAEPLLAAIPGVGASLQQWLPFQAAKHFLTAGPAASGSGPLDGPWVALAYFAGITAVLLAVAVGVAERRDA